MFSHPKSSGIQKTDLKINTKYIWFHTEFIFHSEEKITFQGYIVKQIYLMFAPVLTINSKNILLANFKNA